MYKILPILLFAYCLFAEETVGDTIWYTDDEIQNLNTPFGYWSRSDQDKMFGELIKEEISILINPDFFHILVKFDHSSGVLEYSICYELDKPEIVKPCKITSELTSKDVEVKVYIDKSIYSEEIQRNIVQFIQISDLGLKNCDDCIKVESVNINES